MTSVPHFALPFRFANPHAATTEQDSIDEIADCCFAILVCPQGFRVEMPTFGLPDPVFSPQPLDLDVLREAIDTWEPRASILVSDHPDAFDELLARLEVDVHVRTED